MPPKGKMIGEVLNLSGALSILMMNLLLLSGRFCTVSVITIRVTSVILIESSQKKHFAENNPNHYSVLAHCNIWPFLLCSNFRRNSFCFRERFFGF